MMLEGAQRPRQGQPPSGGKKRKSRTFVRLFSSMPSVAWPSAKGPGNHPEVCGPSSVMPEHARPDRGPHSSARLVHRRESSG